MKVFLHSAIFLTFGIYYLIVERKFGMSIEVSEYGPKYIKLTNEIDKSKKDSLVFFWSKLKIKPTEHFELYLGNI
jgi:hypothetical protein